MMMGTQSVAAVMVFAADPPTPPVPEWRAFVGSLSTMEALLRTDTRTGKEEAPERNAEGMAQEKPVMVTSARVLRGSGRRGHGCE